MRFHDYQTIYDVYRKQAGNRADSVDKFYYRFIREMERNESQIMRTGRSQCLTERGWINGKKPYYSCYSGLVKYLIHLKEASVPVEAVHLPLPQILFRFSADSPQDEELSLEWGGRIYSLKSILAEDFIDERGDRGLVCWQDWGECDDGGFPMLTFSRLWMKAGWNVEQAMNTLPDDPDSLAVGIRIPPAGAQAAVRLVVSCCLLARDLDDGLIEPDVLNADRHKPLTDALVDKAHRRGKIGWLVGARHETEIAPHYRGPCPLALYWTGPGRKVPLYRYRAGCVVKRKVAKEMPTGYEVPN